jgi:Ca-activated chloride channel family protein
MRFENIVLLVLVLCLSATMQLASADGFIIPEPMPELRVPPQLAVKYHHVNVTIGDQYAKTAVDQVFLNEAPYDLEGTYIFPLPEDASISKFSMMADGEELSGRILEKDEAREIYEQIVRRLRDPALLEYVGRNMFRASVYPIPAGRSGVPGEKRIKLSYEQIISCESGVCRFVYPLNTEKFSAEPLQSVAVSVRIKSEKPIKSVYSPTHELAVSRISDYEVSASFEASDVRPEKDFILYYTLSEEDFGVSLLTYKVPGEDGFFMLLASPKYEQNKTIPQDIVFVLDTSGSMAGEKLAQAKGALKFCLNNLNPVDRFDVISFNSDVSRFSESLVAASPAKIKDSLSFVDKLESAGGTDINSALIEALKMTKEGSRPKMIIFLTDGLPTVGTTEVSRILSNADSAGENSTRIFSFGVGFDVNTHLLDQLSGQSRGVSEYVKPGEDIEVSVSSFYTKVKNPVLSDLQLTFSNVVVKETYPRQLPDLFSGSQLIVFGRYSGGGGSLITLKGSDGEKMESFSYEVNFPEEEGRNDFIPRLWASRKIGYLLDEVRLHGENKELVDEIIALSLKYGIMTPYTSFLVDADKSGGEPLRREETRNQLFDMLGALSFKASTGSAAVNSAESVRQLKDSGIDKSGSAKVKSVGSKVFYLNDGVWVDNDFSSGMKATDVVYGSNSYFSMLKDRPDIGKYLSLGSKVKFCLGGACFNIGEDGAENVSVSVPPTTQHVAAGAGTSIPPTTEPPVARSGTTIPQTAEPASVVPGGNILYSTFLVVGSIIFMSATILFLGRRGG